MAREISALNRARLSQLADMAPFVFAFEFEVPTTPDPTRYRITNNKKGFDYGENDQGLPIPYTPWPVKVSPLTADGEGGLPRITITVANATDDQSILTTLDEYEGLDGQPVRLMVINLVQLDDDPVIDEEAQISGVQVNQGQIVFEVSSAPIFNTPMPRFRYSRTRCRHKFGSPLCGYPLGNGNANAFTDCPGYTQEACEQVGAHEEADLGIVGLHPQRFGAQKGIPPRRRG